MTEIEMKAVKELLLKEIDISRLKESLINDLKETLLQEIDISGLKEALTKEIIIKDLFAGGNKLKIDTYNQNQSENKSIDEKVQEKEIVETKKIDLPAYKYGLTDSFKNDHQEILSIFEIIMHLAKEKEYATLPLMLSKFSKKCIEHFAEEEELYAYMKALAGNRSEIERKVANEFSKDMKNLSISLFSILNQSNNIPVTDDTVDGFIQELAELGDILQERIRREEKILYPLYENSRKVGNIC
jgi:regulator of sigma D